ncbi:MAG: dockerin type I repeat-containing protein [Armatimonadota bacterium]
MRRLICSVVLLSGMLGTCGASHAVVRAVLGDVSGDGRVAVDDAVRVLRIALGLTAPSTYDLRLGDVAPRSGKGDRPIGDGVLSVADVLSILRYAVGLVSDQDFGATETLVFVEPSTVVLGPGDRQRFDAMVVGPMPTVVAWRVREADSGLVNSDGVYTAPQTVVGVQTVTVEAQVGASVGTAVVILDESGAPPPPPILW